MKIAVRDYYCPVCGNKEKHTTNHQGEIYCNCKKCGNNPLYCAEVDAFAERPFIEAVLHCYYYNTWDNEKESAAYKSLCEKLTGLGYKMFDVLVADGEMGALAKHDGETVKLYDPEQFDNQYVSSLGRLFQWKQAYSPNWCIKLGYYLELKPS